MAKNPVFGQFCRKWPFLAIFPEKAPVATGVKMPKKPKMGIFLKKGWKFGISGAPGRGFYINPSRRGPAVPRGGKKGV